MEDTKRREVIIKFISENQPCTSQDLVKGVSDKISRVPVFDTLSELMKDGIVKDHKVNRRDHRLFIDTNNPMIVISREIDEFESVYLSLLKKVKDHINRRYYDLKSRDYSSPEHNTSDVADGHPFHRPLSAVERRSIAEADEFLYTTDLISRLLYIFSQFLGKYMLRSITLWPNIIKDRDFLNKLNSTVYSKFFDIQTGMHEIFGSIKLPRGQVSLDDLFHDPMRDTSTNLRESFEKKFNDPGMKKESEKLLTFICKFIGDEMIRQAEYARTSKYSWDITQIDPESIKKTIDETYESHEDYENPFLKYKIAL